MEAQVKKARESVEDIYSLSPMQHGMLFHTLYTPQSGMYVEQLVVTLEGTLDVRSFERAWRGVVARHPILRTTIVWQELDEPLQVVRQQVALSLEELDWRDLSQTEQERRLQTLLQTDRQQEFVLSAAPLMRLVLIRTGEDAYQFVWSFHHILLDGWSVALVVKEVFTFYGALHRGQDIDMQPSRPYRDYIAWLQRQDVDQAKAYWQERLAGFTAPTPLAVDHQQTGRQTGYGKQSIQLPTNITTALQSLAQQHKLTLNTLVQGAWALLLSRYSGGQDVVFGVTVSGRPTELVGVESMVGLFINTLPLRVKVSAQTPLIDWLKDLQQQSITLRQYEYAPLVQVQGWSEVSPGVPLFESILVFENYPIDPTLCESGSSDLKVCNILVEEHLNYPLMLEIVPGWELSVHISYDRQRFENITIARRLDYLRSLLEAMVAGPDRRLSELPLLTDTERQQLLVDWNATEAALPQEHGIHQLFEAQVASSPEATAVVFEEQSLSYAELNARANQLAHHLRSLGVGPDVLVGICVERSLEMVVGLLGILKAGGAYVPLDPGYPQERLVLMLQDTQAPVLLTQERLLHTLPTQDMKAGIEVVCLDRDWKTVARRSKKNSLNRTQPQHLAYVIYTSGSTGKPKGAQVAHRAISNRLQWMQAVYHLTEIDRVLQKTPFSFDVSVWEFFWPLMTGAGLVIAKPGGHQDNAYLVSLIANKGITTFHFVPPMLQVFLDEPGLETCHTLRQIICSGEALPFELQQRFFARLNAQLHNLYGPTEAAVDVTFWACDRESEGPIVPIGRPIANIQLYIVDNMLNAVPIGVPGELYIGGAGLARGYLNRPDLTAERFIPNPFSTEPGARLYQTGDLARYRPDGNIEFLGRIDHQVKVRGFRIELGEIENALVQHPAVREAVVLAREDTPGDKRLVAYVVGTLEAQLNVSDLRDFMKKVLPEYMIPAAFMSLEALPLTPNGKVDRKALPVPEGARPGLGNTYVAPATSIEESLVEIWNRVLGIDRVGIHDNFFELGGDSILSIQVIARANEAGLRLTPKLIFQYPTIAELAVAADTVPVNQAEQGLVTGPVPLTPIQHWFFERDIVERHHWNQVLLLEIREILDPLLLEKAIHHLLMHHDALRLRFVSGDSGWQQVISEPDAVVPFVPINVSEMSAKEQSCAIERKATELQASLCLTDGPLLRVALFDLGSQQPSRLLIIIHHLAIDGVSWRILLEDLQTAYGQLSRGEEVRLPLKTTSFKQWSERLIDYAQSVQRHQQKDYWLAESWTQVSGLLKDYPDGENTVASVRTVSVSLNVEETQALLQEAPKTYRTQINDILLTALAQAFAKWTGQHSLLIDLEGHGREDIFADVDLSRTVGWFTTIFPVLLNLGEIAESGEALKRIKEQLRNIPNHGIGYGLLRYLNQNAEVRGKLPPLPQAEISFNYLGQFDQVLSNSSLFELLMESAGPAQSLLGKRKHVLEINGLVTSARLQVSWTYSENMYSYRTIENLAQEFLESLRALINHCLSPEVVGYTPSDFPLAKFNQQQLNKMVTKFNKAHTG